MIQVRPVIQDDLKKLGVIYKEAYNDITSLQEHWTEESALELMKYFFNRQADLFFVAEIDNKIVGGIVAILKPWWDGNHLTDGEIFVHPIMQKKGIGTELLKHMFAVALRKYEVISWQAYTHHIHDHPMKWYKRLGFRKIKHWIMIDGKVGEVLKKTSQRGVV